MDIVYGRPQLNVTCPHGNMCALMGGCGDMDLCQNIHYTQKRDTVVGNELAMTVTLGE